MIKTSLFTIAYHEWMHHARMFLHNLCVGNEIVQSYSADERIATQGTMPPVQKLVSKTAFGTATQLNNAFFFASSFKGEYMSHASSSFIAKSTIKAADLEHRRKINFNISKYNAVVPQNKLQFSDVSLAREKAKMRNGVPWKTWTNILKSLKENFASWRKSYLGRNGRRCIERDWQNL